MKRGLFGSRFCRLYMKYGASVCFCRGLQEASTHSARWRGAGISWGEEGSEKEGEGRRCRAWFNSKCLQELIELRTHSLPRGPNLSRGIGPPDPDTACWAPSHTGDLISAEIWRRWMPEPCRSQRVTLSCSSHHTGC